MLKEPSSRSSGRLDQTVLYSFMMTISAIEIRNRNMEGVAKQAYVRVWSRTQA